MTLQEGLGNRCDRFSVLPETLASQSAITWLRATQAVLEARASVAGASSERQALREFDWQGSSLLTDSEKALLDSSVTALKEAFGSDDVDLMIDGVTGVLQDDIKAQFSDGFGIVPICSGPVIVFRQDADDADPLMFDLKGPGGNLYERIASKLSDLASKTGKGCEAILSAGFSAKLSAIVACLEDATRFAALEAGSAEKLSSRADEPFVAGYIACALWCGGDDGEFDGCAVSDIAEPSLRDMIETCVDFQSSNAESLVRAYLAGKRFGYSANQAGKDLWLTRNRHGAGFWDRGLGDVGEELSEMAKPYGGADLYLSDDGRIWQVGTEPSCQVSSSPALG